MVCYRLVGGIEDIGLVGLGISWHEVLFACGGVLRGATLIGSSVGR